MESSRGGCCREWARLGSCAALVTSPSGRPALAPGHGSFCLMVTKRLLRPGELKPPPSLLVSWVVASAPTHDWASFQVRVWSDSEPAAERASLALPALWFPEGITNPLPVQIKEQLYHGRTYWKVTQGHQEGKGIHCLVTVLRLGWESLRLGCMSDFGRPPGRCPHGMKHCACMISGWLPLAAPVTPSSSQSGI